ncbi:segregation and condensation protein A [Coxiella-like endosymbiont]|uniref:segregation and condensation protein A n=1 Tax=Coxiella-like endosymbiont TaxID=1592897 RepID=UPI00359C3AB9
MANPRAELVRCLQKYERYKKAACELDSLPHVERDTFIADAAVPLITPTEIYPTVELPELLKALKAVLNRASLFGAHPIPRDLLSIRERMSRIASIINKGNCILFTTLFTAKEGRMGVVVTLIAILELIRQSEIELVQIEPFAPIYFYSKR